ncbi:MAG TPA: ACT domain-containing protein [Verrucomicrobiae bacterium]|nr:ACT domain-containing protein [Verrucomicrobiae bacterium]
MKQLSIFLENKPGALKRPINVLAKSNVNVLALSLADTEQFGILRLIVHDSDKAKRLLESDGFVVKVTDMVAIEVSNQPGGLAAILAPLEKARVNLEYMYGFTQPLEGRGLLLFRFEDPDRAIEALQHAGIKPVRGVDLFEKPAA